MRKILLNKSRGKESINKTNFIPVEIDREMSLFHDEVLSDTIDTFKVYNNEKDASTKHRFIFTLYPLCTNVLFNKISEVVYKEGSDKTTVLENTSDLATSTLLKKGATSSQSVNRIQAIRNTEYTNSKFNLTYHCGLDIFNNHLLRTKEDITVQKKSSETLSTTVYSESGDEITDKAFAKITDGFNTIGDASRSFNGSFIFSYIPNANANYTYNGSVKVKTPLYMHDTIKSFNKACKDGIKRQNGWIGFTNPSTLRIPIKKSEEYYVNRCINNKEACEFIDLAPERDLFSFTPKKNTHQQRTEKNWDYCLTYPYKSIYKDPTQTILKGKKFGISFIKNNDGSVYREYIANNGVNVALFRCPVKHNLKVGDSIYLNLGKLQGNTLTFSGRIKCTVVSLGTLNKKNEDRYFSIRKDDLEDLGQMNEIIGFSKIVHGGLACEYYLRLFKKMEGKYNSVINRLAFAGTIYGDDISQIVFTDDIDIKDYRDNRGRPLSEIYLTILKANRGHKEWYEDKDYANSKIEFSHVFGKVSSGLDLPEFINDREFPIVRFQHNISEKWLTKNTFNVKMDKSSSSFESDITIENDTFYGDLVEFNPLTLDETTLENVYHRFNTAQREITGNDIYDTLYYDEIAGDIYDAGTNAGTTPRIRIHELNKGYANLAPEGYIYQPHYKIQIAKFKDDINQGDDIIIDVSGVKRIKKDSGIEFNTNINYNLLPNDIISFMNSDNDVFKFIVTSYTYSESKKMYVGTATLSNMSSMDLKLQKLNECIFYRHSLDIPDYAYMLPDGSGRHLWKDIQLPSEWMFTDELYTTTFTNGAFYHQKNIIFPVRRQDPFGKYSMVLKKNGAPINNNYEMLATEFDYSSVEHMLTNTGASCF
jgi:hypothetical protein